MVCTAGILENGQWIRIYPVPLSFLTGLRKDGKIESFKYNWIELDLEKRANSNDFRPESHSPTYYDFRDIILHGKVGTENNWAERKRLCTSNVYTNMKMLLSHSRDPQNTSLATFKPTEILDFYIKEEENREWKDEWKELRKQGDLFEQDRDPEIVIPKLPYKFYYRFRDDEGTESRLMIEDWEIGALYWNCLRSTEGNEPEALKLVRDKYERSFLNEKDIYLFLGTTNEWHRRRAKNPFVIIGVFYPKKSQQDTLF